MKSFLLNLEDNIHQDLKRYSVDNNVSMNDATVGFIDCGLQNKPTKNFAPKRKIKSSIQPEQRIGEHKTFFKE